MIEIRLTDMFTIGPGPSSSHTVGPMRAALTFRQECIERALVPAQVVCTLFGSLRATGRGHGTDRAVLAGLCGHGPEDVDCDALQTIDSTLQSDPSIPWGAGRLRLDPEESIAWSAEKIDALPHPNTMVFQAFDTQGQLTFEDTICSVGGGFLLRPAELETPFAVRPPSAPIHAFSDMESLLDHAESSGLGFGDMILENEREWDRVSGEPGRTERRLDAIFDCFQACIRRGLGRSGVLPGGLGLRRRAAELMDELARGEVEESYVPIARGQAYAYAINEENAAGQRVVTAPTNGAAGIFPAVLVEAHERLGLDRGQIHRAIATGGAVAMVIKAHASLSGADVGCQGEVGSATAMAAAALCEIWGGTGPQVENAAEIGLEHNLGLTCDPIKGLVQAPCIERNAMGVAKAWSAAKLARHTEGRGLVSFDKVIRVMRRTGLDMRREYKETAEGGLAVAIPEC